jgi:hypothetical protein
MGESQVALDGIPTGTPAEYGPSGRAGAPPVRRVRLTFEKGAALRYISHLDLVRMWERAFRRAKLPLSYTLGYTPHPRLSFAAPLALGWTSTGEILDVYLREALSAEALVARIGVQLPGGCVVRRAEILDVAGPSVTSLTRWATYTVLVSGLPVTTENAEKEEAVAQGSRWSGGSSRGRSVPTGEGVSQVQSEVPWRAQRLPPPPADQALPPLDEIEAHIRALLTAEALPRERVREGKRTAYDLRPLVMDVWLERGEVMNERARLGMTLRLDSNGAGRPDEVAAALGVRARLVERVKIGLEGEDALLQMAAVGDLRDATGGTRDGGLVKADSVLGEASGEAVRRDDDGEGESGGG